uniref:Wsv453 n=1 Tax=White spot syndrome virus TaxID=92652 RepID=A0A2U9GBG0_WSSV|nr:wsv453 [Shrimp white spot syndrome virus]AWQ62682.1 wsv453 [Shrimp white spot syndrome virus]
MLLQRKENPFKAPDALSFSSAFLSISFKNASLLKKSSSSSSSNSSQFSSAVDWAGEELGAVTSFLLEALPQSSTLIALETKLLLTDLTLLLFIKIASWRLLTIFRRLLGLPKKSLEQNIFSIFIKTSVYSFALSSWPKLSCSTDPWKKVLFSSSFFVSASSSLSSSSSSSSPLLLRFRLPLLLHHLSLSSLSSSSCSCCSCCSSEVFLPHSGSLFSSGYG